jgi:hypothetical protein
LRRFDLTLIDPTNPWSSFNAAFFLQRDYNVRITRRKLLYLKHMSRFPVEAFPRFLICPDTPSCQFHGVIANFCCLVNGHVVVRDCTTSREIQPVSYTEQEVIGEMPSCSLSGLSKSYG